VVAVVAHCMCWHFILHWLFTHCSGLHTSKGAR
jgi:hypothetical protein